MSWTLIWVSKATFSTPGLLEKTSTTELTYIVNSELEADKEIFTESFEILGLLIGKALFERIPIQIFLNRTIIKYILNEE